LPNDALPQLRPNQSRSVEVFGDFSDDLACRIATQVSKLKAESSDSITVYINSLGGGIRELDIIDGILRSPNLDAEPCLYITVAVGNAASAAANLLAFGYYSYAYEHSLIYFHGARRTDIPEAAVEDATQLANELQRLNLKISRRLAISVIGRLAYTYQSLWPDFKTIKIKQVPQEFELLFRYLKFVARNLSPRARHLANSTYRQMESARELSEKILPVVVPKMGKRINPAADDAKVLIGVIKHELKINKGKPWMLDERGVNQIVADYLLLRDYNLGEHRALVHQLLRSFGVGFLSDEEFKKYEKLKDDRKKTLELLTQCAAPYLLPLWYFTVSLCRQLMRGETRLTPTDGYYLGLVDEVIGTKLIGRRLVAEQIVAGQEAVTKTTKKPTSPASPSTSAPEPPS
jgi:ATP-dependent protease ClpP protease subunit